MTDTYWLEARVESHGPDYGRLNGSHFRFERAGVNTAWHITDVVDQADILIYGGRQSHVVVNGKRLGTEVIPTPWNLLVSLVDQSGTPAGALAGSIVRRQNDIGGQTISYATGTRGVEITVVSDADRFAREVSIRIDGHSVEFLRLTTVRSSARDSAIGELKLLNPN